jgi:hypothetical protein
MDNVQNCDIYNDLFVSSFKKSAADVAAFLFAK